MASVPLSEGGAAGGIYKMASSLGNAMGVAISATLYAAGRGVDPAVIQSWGLFIGNQDNVSLRFGGVKALRDISLTVGSGDRWAVVGRNGTGKTTLVRLITGDLTPTSGAVIVTTRVACSALRHPVRSTRPALVTRRRQSR